MTGFRSGKSGSLISEAKTAGRAIGKRRVWGNPSNDLFSGFLSFPFLPSFLRPQQPSPEKPEPFLAPCRPRQEAAANPFPSSSDPLSKYDLVWRKHRDFKAAEWRRWRRACCLDKPAA